MFWLLSSNADAQQQHASAARSLQKAENVLIFGAQLNASNISSSTVPTHWSETWKNKYSSYNSSTPEIETEQNGWGVKD